MVAKLANSRRYILWIATGLLVPLGVARAQNLRAGRAVRQMEQAAGASLDVAYSPSTGLVTFVASPKGEGIPVRSPASASARERAASFLADYGAAFAIASEGQFAVSRVSPPDEAGMEHVRIQQNHLGVPVAAGELMIHLRGSNVVAVNGETLPDLETLSTSPVLEPSAAAAIVLERLDKQRGITNATLSEPRLEIINRSLLEDGRFPTHLAWYIEARRIDLRERFWIDAVDGTLVLQFSQLTTALSRFVYDGGSGSSLPGTLVRSEGGTATGDGDADAAYDYSGDTYDYFLASHGRDSFDGAGASIVSTVHHCPGAPDPCPWNNAAWNGTQMIYGDGLSLADDVDAHELTHAVTDYTADLFYYQQSGALNESFSDIFGETVDLTNGAGTDGSGVRWQIGEDLPVIGAIRDLMDPTVFGQPGKTSDVEFVCQDPGPDSGGVHSNSGVPNHAYALMVDGGSYNGYTITGIGAAKAGRIEYRVLSQYLLSGSGFLDAYFALGQACQDLIGVSGITASNCTQVSNAINAVELWYYWRCSGSQQWQFDACLNEGGQVPLFFDDLESGGANWLVANAIGSTSAWFLGDFYATSGTHHLWGQDLTSINDSRVFMASAVAIPSDTFLHFRHSFGFENSGANYYDGGVVEYSTDGGGSWIDAGSLIDFGALYGGTISNSFSNPLGGRSAFVGDSYGYTTTRINLSPLAGQSVKFRFRVGSDTLLGDRGWFIDDVGIFRCGVIFTDGFESSNTSAWSHTVD